MFFISNVSKGNLKKEEQKEFFLLLKIFDLKYKITQQMLGIFKGMCMGLRNARRLSLLANNKIHNIKGKI